jgi:hypothetical protein
MGHCVMMARNASITHKNGLFNPLNAELNPICHLLALLGVHHILHVSRVRVKVTKHHSETEIAYLL